MKVWNRHVSIGLVAGKSELNQSSCRLVAGQSSLLPAFRVGGVVLHVVAGGSVPSGNYMLPPHLAST